MCVKITGNSVLPGTSGALPQEKPNLCDNPFSLFSVVQNTQHTGLPKLKNINRNYPLVGSITFFTFLGLCRHWNTPVGETRGKNIKWIFFSLEGKSEHNCDHGKHVQCSRYYKKLWHVFHLDTLYCKTDLFLVYYMWL